MGITEENTLRKFIMIKPDLEDRITKQEEVGILETIFTLDNGERILYDELNGDRIIFLNSDRNKTDFTRSEWMLEFSRRLRRYMAIRNIRQIEMADKLGIAESTFSRYMNAKSIPDGYIIKQLAKHLRCSESDLMDFNYLL